MKHLIIAIDGPSGSGKGTLAKRLAAHLGFSYLDTGLLYRATGFKMLASGSDVSNMKKAVQVARHLKHEDFKDADALRSEAVASAASRVAAYPEVRQALLELQREVAHRPLAGVPGVVLDGRDIGTVVCPDAQVKLFITASLDERAKRRLKDLQMRGIDSIYEDVLEDVRARDQRDSERETAPLKPSEDALVLNTTEMSIDDVFEKAMAFIDKKRQSLQPESSAS